MMRKVLVFIYVMSTILNASSQTYTNKGRLEQLSGKYYEKSYENKRTVIEYAKKYNIPIRYETDSTLVELMYIDQRGNPQYYTIHNENAAKTISTEKVYSGGGAGLSLDGS